MKDETGKIFTLGGRQEDPGLQGRRDVALDKAAHPAGRLSDVELRSGGIDCAGAAFRVVAAKLMRGMK